MAFSIMVSNPTKVEAWHITTFRDVPGITSEEIAAIENVIANRDYFIYAMLLNEEAFYTIDGNVSGFAYRMSNWLTGFFGIPFIPTIVEWGDLMVGMENHTIDFSGQLASTPERREFLTMTSSIVMRPVTYAKKASYTPLLELDRTPRFVFNEGAVTIYTLKESNVFPEFEAIFVASTEKAAPLILSGYADAFFGDGAMNLSLLNPEISFYNLYPPVFRHASFSAQNPELIPFVNVIQKFLEEDGLTVFGEIYNEGSIDFRRHLLQLSFTEEDIAFIETNPVIRVGANIASYPISFINTDTQELEGIAVDVLREIEMLTGIGFEIESSCACNVPNFLETTKNSEIDVAVGVIHVCEIAYPLIPSDNSIFESQFILISSIDFPQIGLNEVLFAHVGLLADSIYERLFFEYFPDHTRTTKFANIDELLNALKGGEIDMAFASNSRLLYLNNFLGNPGFWANIELYSLCIVHFVLNSDNYNLNSVINKTMDFIDINAISRQWEGRTFDYTARLMQAQLPGLIGALILFICVVTLLTLLLIRRNNQKEILEKLVKERTESLQMEKTLLNTLFDSIPDVIFCKNLDLKYIRFNQAFEKLFELGHDDIINKDELEALGLSKESVEVSRMRDLTVIEDKTIVSAEETVLTEEGTVRVYETVKTPLITQNGEILGLVGLARDITMRKDAEEAIIKTSNAKTVFISNMSHEIRTPMNSIIGFSELAMEDAAPKTQLYLDRIAENAKWLLQIIDDILDISKIESGKVELEEVPFSLKDVFAQCNNMVMQRASEKGLKLFFYTEPLKDGCLMLGDPVRLRQIFINLLSNAIKFTDVGMIRVTSSEKEFNAEDNKATIYFEIRDTGIGMTEEQIDRIFEPFMQGDISTTRKYGGTGLGLAITKNLIEMMGGRLTVTSVKGLGSKFSFEITFNVVKGEEIKEVNTTDSDKIKQPVFDAEILVCEDNEMNQIVIQEHLSRIGIKAVIAENGKEGVDKVNERIAKGSKPFDLIFMDIHMPVMDGLEAAKRIVALNVGTPIITMTANIMTTDKEIYSQHGMIDCIGKPFTSQELWGCLLKHLTPIRMVEHE